MSIYLNSEWEFVAMQGQNPMDMKTPVEPTQEEIEEKKAKKWRLLRRELTCNEILSVKEKYRQNKYEHRSDGGKYAENFCLISLESGEVCRTQREILSGELDRIPMPDFIRA